jgi:hypothetical protein
MTLSPNLVNERSSVACSSLLLSVLEYGKEEKNDLTMHGHIIPSAYVESIIAPIKIFHNDFLNLHFQKKKSQKTLKLMLTTKTPPET